MRIGLILIVACCIITASAFNLNAGESSLGRPIKAQIRDATLLETYKGISPKVIPTEQLLDDAIKNLEAHVDEANLNLSFDIDFEKWPFSTRPMTPTGEGRIVSERQLLVRCFDENGEYLTHFITSEYFTPEWAVCAMDPIPFIQPGGKMLIRQDMPYILRPKGNNLSYTLNRRDADYIRHVEVGFFVPGTTNDYLLKDYVELGETSYFSDYIPPENQKIYNHNKENGVTDMVFAWTRVFQLYPVRKGISEKEVADAIKHKDGWEYVKWVNALGLLKRRFIIAGILGICASSKESVGVIRHRQFAHLMK